MKIITVYAKTLTRTKLSGLLIAVNERPISKPLKYTIELTNDSYSKVLLCLEHGIVDIVLDDLDIIQDVVPNKKVMTQKVDSNLLIKKLVIDAGGELSKQDFADQYCKIVGCVKRTAENHLYEALEKGYIKEKDYYTIVVPGYDKTKIINAER